MEFRKMHYSNLYIKNLPPEMTTDSLRDLFKNFGDIENVFIPSDRINNSYKRGYGFINFKYHDDALKAEEQMNGYEVAPGYELQIGRAERKKERFQYQSLNSHFSVNYLPASVSSLNSLHNQNSVKSSSNTVNQSVNSPNEMNSHVNETTKTTSHATNTIKTNSNATNTTKDIKDNLTQSLSSKVSPRDKASDSGSGSSSGSSTGTVPKKPAPVATAGAPGDYSRRFPGGPGVPGGLAGISSDATPLILKCHFHKLPATLVPLVQM
ncbi:unnamed protein product [Ambrosiozyma monospora]|uniref:Unnamed protein product n=1 Tax=Ambrosiozyma monospora TaxID=43982 RepID=A0A9W6Z5A8_AMBMO|nr:unnamed protein product [Ambrosiozyma monospora]